MSDENKVIQIPLEELYGKIFDININHADNSNTYNAIQKILLDNLGFSDHSNYSVQRTIPVPETKVSEILGNQSWIYHKQALSLIDKLFDLVRSPESELRKAKNES